MHVSNKEALVAEGDRLADSAKRSLFYRDLEAVEAYCGKVSDVAEVKAMLGDESRVRYPAHPELLPTTVRILSLLPEVAKAQDRLATLVCPLTLAGRNLDHRRRRKAVDDAADKYRAVIQRVAHATESFGANQESIPNTGGDADEPLTENDRCILQAMLELDATVDRPVSSDTILKKALASGDGKRAFNRLRRSGLVAARRRHGRWLTEKGLALARQLENQNH